MSAMRFSYLAWAAIPVAVLLLAAPVMDRATSQETEAPTALSTLAIPFVENVGAPAGGARFTARTFAGAVHVTDAGELVYALPRREGGSATGGVVLRERLASTTPQRAIAGSPSSTHVSVFRGSDPAGWASDLPTTNAVSVCGASSGVELDVQASASNVEKLFRVPAGVEPDAIHMTVAGALGLSVTDEGELAVATAEGDITFSAPVAYQDTPGGRAQVDAAYVVEGDGYGFVVSGHDASLPLVIDPLIASTYLGSGGNDWGQDIGIEPVSGDVYVAGYTDDAAFPTTPGSVDPSFNGSQDAFIARLSSDLTTLLSCTFLGGDAADAANAVSVEFRGIWTGGRTTSGNFPTTAGVVFPATPGGSSDGWVARLSFDLMTLDAATYYGGSGTDEVKDVVSAGGAVYLAGETRSDDLWFSSGAVQTVRAGAIDCFFTTMSLNLDGVTFQTLFGGSSGDSVSRIAPAEGRVLACGDTYSTDFPVTPGAYSTSVTGEGDAWVAHLYDNYVTVQGCTYLGGASTDSEIETATDISWGGLDDAIVVGYTNAETFPTTSGAYKETFPPGYNDEGYITSLDTNMSSVLASTFLGGSGSDEIHGVIVRGPMVYVTGHTSSDDFPATVVDTTYGGSRDAFVAALPTGLYALHAATYLGGPSNESGRALAVQGDTIFVTGHARGPDFPTTTGAYDETYNATGLRADAFVTSLTLAGGEPPPVEIDSYILPKKVNVLHKEPVERSRLSALGIFDLGSEPVNLSGAATLTVGDEVFAFAQLPVNRKGVFTFRQDGVQMKIKPSKYGGSKAKFKLKMNDARIASIPTDEPLAIRFQTGELDGTGEVGLTKGRYKISRRRGELIQPHVCLFNCRARIKGAGKDAFKVKLGLATGDGTPAEAPAVTVRVGDTFTQTILADAFVLKGGKWIFKGPKTGVTLLKLDYEKEKLTLVGKAADLGPFAPGEQAVLISVTLGEGDPYAIRVRMVRKKANLKY